MAEHVPHTTDIPLGHGTKPMILDLIVQDPPTVRRYGRRFIRSMTAHCRYCRVIDARDARLRRMRTAYGRRPR